MNRNSIRRKREQVRLVCHVIVSHLFRDSRKISQITVVLLSNPSPPSPSTFKTLIFRYYALTLKFRTLLLFPAIDRFCSLCNPSVSFTLFQSLLQHFPHFSNFLILWFSFPLNPASSIVIFSFSLLPLNHIIIAVLSVSVPTPSSSSNNRTYSCCSQSSLCSYCKSRRRGTSAPTASIVSIRGNPEEPCQQVSRAFDMLSDSSEQQHIYKRASCCSIPSHDLENNNS